MVINIATKKAQKKISELCAFPLTNLADIELAKSADIRQFCRTLTETFRWNKFPLIALNSDDGKLTGSTMFLKKGNLLYYSNDCWPVSIDDNFIKVHLSSLNAPSGAFVSCPTRFPDNEGMRVLLLINADTDDARWKPLYSVVGEITDADFPVVSWSALANYYDDKIENVNSALSNGRLRLKDYTPDESIAFTDEDKKERRKKNPKLIPPRLGFTAISTGWHRTGFCVLYDEDKKICLLTGQDEGSYFVVELPKKVSTVEAALDVLIPEEARVPGVKRQGEWFFVPCDEKDVPALKDTILLFDTSYDSERCVYMPLDDDRSNKHHIETCDGRVGKDGYLYVLNVTMGHDQHDEVSMKSWCYLIKNTAVSSYSEGGVD